MNVGQGRARDQAVAVTGIGMITPLGVSGPACWDQMLQGRSAVKPITKFDPAECETRIGGELPDEYLELEKKHTSKRLGKMTVRASRIIRLCAREAVEDTGLSQDELPGERCAVVIGTSGSSVRSPDDAETKATAKFRIIREMINAMPAWISIDHGLQGPTYTVSAGGCSGAVAVSEAYELICRGAADLAIAGGVDTLLTANNVKAWNAMGLLSLRNDDPARAVRSFDKTRDGYVLADGGCAVVLESKEHAMRRGARIYAWTTGSATRFEAANPNGFAPEEGGMAEAMRSALQSAQTGPESIGYVNANGSSAVQDDLLETRAIKRVFGDHARNLLVSSQKPMLGHTMGASGAIEFAVTALSLFHQRVLPTINYREPDPRCDLNYVTNRAAAVDDLETAITNSFSLGGHSNTIVLGRTV